MGSQKTKRSVRVTVYVVVWGSVFGTLAQAVNVALWRALEQAVDVAVFRAVNQTVFRVVRGAVREDPEHPALQDFLREVTA
jgi:hypothetical protein